MKKGVLKKETKRLKNVKFRKIFRTYHRTSRLEVLCIKGALKNIATFTGKHLCQESL